jgi:hypothetical protein
MEEVVNMLPKVAHRGGEILDLPGAVFNTGHGRQFVSYFLSLAHG